MQKKIGITDPIRYIKGIGPRRAEALERLGIRSIEDSMYYFPRRYEDRSRLLAIAQVKEGEHQTIRGNVVEKNHRRSWKRRGFDILELVLSDRSDRIHCVWFNQPYLNDLFHEGQTLIAYGKAERYSGRLQMTAPEFEIEADPGQQDEEDASESLQAGRIVPVYTLPQGISQRLWRKTLKHILDSYVPQVRDLLPYDIRKRAGVVNLAKSLVDIHFPGSFEAQKEAYTRLSFEEFFLFQLPLALRKVLRKEKTGVAHRVESEVVDAFLGQLPFRLTRAQERVLREIQADMGRPQPMQRLLQGDVGSGKTIVAAIAGLIAVQGGYQAAFMVPTEILARQHYGKISSQVSRIMYQGKKIRIGLLVGSIEEKEKKKIYKQIEAGEIDIVIGTHAILEERAKFKNLGLAVIDEQHKFGVGQRALLPRKGANPDVLIMTATPIPRTLAITLYGDLDISVIDELPGGRKPVKTFSITDEARSEAYALARKQMDIGRQVYIIYPVIEESYAMDIAGAKKMYERLKAGEFRSYKLGIVHGRLKQKEQDAVMSKFERNEINLLVATTVLEVGIDIPNATCMIIEHAERFGLSQLHQLRGRVGRGPFGSFCALVSGAQSLSEDARSRLEAMVSYADGFRIAEEDLKIRGPGEFFGSRQHGLSELKIGNPLVQMQLLKKAREEAVALVAEDLRLEAKQHAALKTRLLERFPGYETLFPAG